MLFSRYVDGAAEPMLLFAGQSNMIGHSADGQSLTGDYTLQDYLLSRWLSNPIQRQDYLAEFINNAYVNRKIQHQTDRAAYQAHLVTEMYNQSIITKKWKQKHRHAKCTFLNPKYGSGSDVEGQNETVPVSSDAGCGQSFGHELAFSHSMESWKVPYTISKVADGGTEIYKHWFPNVGTHWDALNQTIHNATAEGNGEWLGFAWHQGENDCFTSEKYQRGDPKDAEDTSFTYLGNLTELIATVRTELFRSNTMRRWSNPKEIPVAIFELGKFVL